MKLVSLDAIHVTFQPHFALIAPLPTTFIRIHVSKHAPRRCTLLIKNANPALILAKTVLPMTHTTVVSAKQIIFFITTTVIFLAHQAHTQMLMRRSACHATVFAKLVQMPQIAQLVLMGTFCLTGTVSIVVQLCLSFTMNTKENV